MSFYGDAQALDGVSLEIPEGDDRRHRRRQRRRQVLADPHHRRHASPARGRIVFRGTDIAGWPSHRVCNLGIGQVAEGRQVFPTLSVAENLELGAMLPRARAGTGAKLERVLALFPRARRARGAGRRHAFRAASSRCSRSAAA